MSGNYTKKTEETVLFIEALEKQIKVPVETVDERLSSVEAKKNGGGSGIDEQSARIILERYLDEQLVINS